MDRRAFLAAAAAASGLALPAQAQLALPGRIARLASFDNMADLGVVGLQPGSWPRWRAALAAGTGLVAIAGDSKDMGEGAKSQSVTPDLSTDKWSRQYAWPAVAAQILTAGGKRAIEQSFFSNGRVTAVGGTHDNYDTRFLKGASWAVFTNEPTLGGAIYRSLAAGAARMTSDIAVDSAVFYSTKTPAVSALTLSVDGVANQVLDQNGANAFVQTTVNLGSPGIHYLEAARTTNTVFMVGCRMFNSTNPALEFLNMAACQWKASDWNDATQPWRPKAALMAIAPPLLVLPPGTNEMIGGVAVSTFKTNMQGIIDAMLPTTDIALVVPAGINPASVSQSTQDAYRAAYFELQAANPATVLMDLPSVYGTYAEQQAAGRVYDQYHENRAGHAFKAARMAPLLGMSRRFAS